MLYTQMDGQTNKHTHRNDNITSSANVGGKYGNNLLQIEELVSDAVSRGAHVVCGGSRHKQLGGNYFLPTILTGVTQEMDIFHNEIFGPVASIIR